MLFKTSLLALGLCAAASALPQSAAAKDCFILVHGHTRAADTTQDPIGVDPNAPNSVAYGYNYWRTTNGDFIQSVTQNGLANHGVIRWNAYDGPHKAYWQADVVASVVAQLISITSGQGDYYSHAGQCSASDRFYVVAHSQGAQVMTYINANAYPGARFYNKGLVTADGATITASTLAGAATTALPLDTAMSKITALITIGGAINGTQGMDIVCTNGASKALAEQVVGAGCTPSLQTLAQYNPSANSGSKMLKPTYHFGGTASFAMPLTASSALLGGEDDGTVNLASQMNCAGSPTRDLESDLREYAFGVAVTFSCNNLNKRHSNTFNVGTFDQDHESERGVKTGTVAQDTGAADALNCGTNLDMSRAIPKCVASGSL
ncbi:MAG: hypothetical protein QM778_34715 [Myxococcales bacterium]